MKAVITGDIVNSQSIEPQIWLNALEDVLGQRNPAVWEIYRGDEFQFLLEDAKDSLIKAIEIKARIKMIKGLDVRISIGLGSQDFKTDKVSQSNGTAFVNSGRQLEKIKNEKINLGINSGISGFDDEFNLIFKWLGTTSDDWSVVSAEIIYLTIQNLGLTQEDLAKKINVSQSSISQRLKRAQFYLIKETDQYFRKKVAEL
ncbi:MAG: helix-turn-helix domain-containing protein [Flavobacteriia bacterium]|nr:helix-turn-helix domain-containing protein [Flavobacteriia bacterium]MBH2022953.1 helix-turn-helix domain-containing protein [Flavobacteriales bacterium]